MDGNFSAVHLQHQNAGLDRYISNRSLYMVGETKYPILLPSALGHSMCKKLNLQTILQAELALCEGQANDALYAI